MGKTSGKITWKVSEERIEKAVVRHFEDLGFVTKRQHTIQIGSRVGRPDVVLWKLAVEGLLIRYDSLAAIVECKAAGKVDHGIPQLHSYLCATDTRLGVFANSLSSTSWKYYENYGRNHIPEISREQFLSILRGESEKREEFQRRIQKRTNDLIQQESKKLVTDARIQERVAFIIDEEAKTRVNENDFRSATERNLKIILDNSKNEIASLKETVKEKNGCLTWSILALGVLVAILLLTAS